MRNFWKKKVSDVGEKIRRTANDLITLEINTIVKTDMSCLKPSDDDRLALYYLAGIYHDELLRLGAVYINSISDDKKREKELAGIYEDFKDGWERDKGLEKQNFKINSDKFQELSKTQIDKITPDEYQENFFRRYPLFHSGGICSFLELAYKARKAQDWISSNQTALNLEMGRIKSDCMILSRIELKSREIVKIIENKLKEEKKKEKAFMKKYHDIFYDYGLRKNLINYLDALANHIKEIFCEKDHIQFISPNNDFKLNFDLRDKMVIRKALDLGVENVVMQTRIGMDGDITTRIAEKFAKEPKQFILDIHNESIQTSIDFWGKIVNALVSFGSKILRKYNI